MRIVFIILLFISSFVQGQMFFPARLATASSGGGLSPYPDSEKIAEYTASEGSGVTTADVTGNGYTATLNSVTFSGGGLAFDGTNNHYVNVPNLLDTFPDIGTIQFDYTPTGTDPSDVRFFSKIIGATRVQFYKKGTTGKLVFSESDTPPDYTWNISTTYQITVTWEGVRLFIYINGVFYSSQVKPSSFDATGTPNDFIIGAFDNDDGTYLTVPLCTLDNFLVRDDFYAIEKSLSDYNNTPFVASTIMDKLLPQAGTIVIEGNGTNENNSVLEPHTLKRNDTLFKYYTVNYADASQKIHVAYSTNGFAGTWTKYSGNPIVSGATHTCSYAFGDSIYIFSGGGNVTVMASRDGFNFGAPREILNSSAFPNITSFGNISVDDSLDRFLMAVECAVTTGETWFLHRAISSSIGSGWSITHKMTGIQAPTKWGMTQTGVGTTGGADIRYIAGTFHMVYHCSFSSLLPTYLAYATSTNSVDWTIVEAPFKMIFDYPFPSMDQAADPSFYLEETGKVYIEFEYCNNVGIQDSHIRVWTFTGTLNQLITP